MSARRVFLLYTAINAIAMKMIFTALAAYYVRVIGMSPLQLVLTGTAIEVTAFVFEVPTGIVADVYSRRLSVLIGGFLISLTYLLEGSLPLFAVVIAAEVIRGIGETFRSGATEAWITDEIGAEHMGELHARNAQVWRVCWVIGTLISVALASLFGYQAAILTGAGLLLLFNIALCFIMPETGFVRPERAIGATLRDDARTIVATLRQSGGVVRGTPVVLLLVVAEIIRGGASEGWDRLWESHVLNNFSLPVLSLPIIGIGALDPIAWFAVVEFLGMIIGVPFWEVVKRRFTVTSATPNATVARWLMASYAIVVVCSLGFAVTGSFALAIIFLVLRELFYGPPGTISGTWINLHIPGRVRATVLSMLSQANALGQFGAGPAVGAVGGSFGVRAALALASALHAPLLWLYGRFIRRGNEIGNALVTELEAAPEPTGPAV